MRLSILLLTVVLLFGGCVSPGKNNSNRKEQVSYDRYFVCEGSTYAYDSLGDLQKIWYEDMVNILGSMAEGGELSEKAIAKGLGKDDVDHIFQCVMVDHPEFFYVEGYSFKTYEMASKLESLEFSGIYNVDREKAVGKKKRIEDAADQIQSEMMRGLDDYGKIKYVYETLIKNTEYREESEDSHNIYSVFVEKESVCQGYAKATQYLLNRMGVECTLAIGTVRGGGKHGWNLVKADGEYYYVDTTWGDASYRSQDSDHHDSGAVPEINYDYLCVTTAELEKTHSCDHEIEMPVCTATKDNYYIRENAFFTELDTEKLRRLFAFPDFMHADQVSLKCADQRCYEEIYCHLIKDNHEYYGEDTGRVLYVLNDDQYSMTFWVTNR